MTTTSTPTVHIIHSPLAGHFSLWVNSVYQGQFPTFQAAHDAAFGRGE